MKKRILSLIAVCALVLTLAPISAFAAPEKTPGGEIIVDDNAGAILTVDEQANGIVEVTASLKGIVNITAFQLVVSYDASKVSPYNRNTQTILEGTKLNSASAIAPYMQILPSSISGWTIMPFTIDSLNATTKYFAIGLTDPVQGDKLTLASGEVLPIYKVYFKEKSAINANTFSYAKTPGIASYSKFTNGTSNVFQQVATPTRPDLFTKVFNPYVVAKNLSGITATTPPTKTTYTEGETLDTAGMVVTASYSDSTSAAVTGYTCSPTTLSATGTQTITVSYTEGAVTKETTFNVTVNPTPDLLPDTGRIRATATDTTNGSAIGDVLTSDAPGFLMNYVNNLDLGKEVTIQAANVPGKTFRYWKNVPSGRIVSTSQSYKFKVGSDTYLTAVYSEPQSGQYLVEFIDKNGKVLQSNYLNQNAAIVKPADPFTVGYTFTGWSPTVPATATENSVFNAQYTVLDPSYTLTVAGPAAVEGGNQSPYAFNKKVTLSVDTEQIPANEKFVYWQRGGKIISYETSYSFYVWDSTTVTAVCASDNTTVTAAPQIIMDSVKVIGNRVIVMSERTVPAGYELIETGIIMKQGSATAGSLKLVGGSYDLKAVAQSADANGQFSVRKDNTSGTWNARAYLIYKSGTSLKVIYSNIVNGTV